MMNQRDAVAREFGMTGEILIVTVRRALLFYLLDEMRILSAVRKRDVKLAQAASIWVQDLDSVCAEMSLQISLIAHEHRPILDRLPSKDKVCDRDRSLTTCCAHGVLVVFGERHLRHVLLSYMNYYNEMRTHLSLGKDAPTSRRVHRAGHILCRPVLGGLHNQYVRI